MVISILVCEWIKEITWVYMELNPRTLGFNYHIHLSSMVTWCKIKYTDFQLENSNSIISGILHNQYSIDRDSHSDMLASRLSWNCFCSHVDVCEYVFVCPTPRALITSGMILCDIGYVWLVKPVLQLFSLLPSINWMGVALLTQRVVHTRPKYQSWCCTSHGRRHIMMPTQWPMPY